MENKINPNLKEVAEVFIAKPETRKKFYAGFVLAGLVLTGIITYCGAVGVEIPAQIIGANAIYNMLSATGFVVAVGNTKNQETIVKEVEVLPTAPESIEQVVTENFKTGE